MGAIPITSGSAFRVWAPNASAVAVAGDFNAWSATANPLVNDGGGLGNWSATINDAVIGDQYKYVITHPTYGVVWRQDPRALDMTNSAGNSVIADLSYTWVNGFTMPAWNQMVIYEMHVGTFNDAVGGPVGTFDSVTAKMSHLSGLGVNAIKIMPIMEFPGDQSWGYNPHSQYAPESAYGTPRDLKELVDAAHGAGIAVILDVVYNHMGTSPTESDIPVWNFDAESYGNGGIYFFSDWRKQTPWGWSRPDYGRGEVRTYLRDSALYWLNEYRCDGLRWDSTVNIRTQNNGGGGDIAEGWTLMQWINNEIDAAASWKISIAEDLQNNDWITKTTGAGGTGFDSQWDAAYVHPVRTAVVTGNDADRDMYAVRDAITHYYNGTATQRVIYTESHDEVNNGKSRVPEEIWPGNAGSWYSKKRSTLAAGITMTSPGVPMIFMGQEFLEDGFWSDSDPLDWTKNTTYAGIKSLYTDLIKLRRNWYNNTRGLRGNNLNIHHVNNTNKVIAYHRWEAGGAGDDCIVVANFGSTGYSSYNLGFPSTGTWYVRFNSDWNGYSSDFGNWNSYNTTAVAGAKDGMANNANVGIGPYSLIILSK
ncbi:alpha amylase C-terminal domain-containing protein [Candidatus Poribacteria bacterium]|nr:alpha amylase C-terminal domain-containing protein [Candidatus Poribacteria bacterium]